jgi:O-acetyl-ADP-ribose deacetylase (regulator of RNase III)
MKVQVVGGSVVTCGADAIVTAINSGGMWFGGIDRVIQNEAGELFHRQAEAAMPLMDGQVIVARGNGGRIKNVVFVVDDLKLPLWHVVLVGLMEADMAGFKSVALPTIRMGVMLGKVEKSVDEALDQMYEGVRRLLETQTESLEEITFVVFNDQKIEAALREKMAALTG